MSAHSVPHIVCQTLQQVLHPVELEEVLRMGDAGAQILDVRDAAEYAKGHIAGSINIGLGGQYATWAGTVLDPKRPIVIIAEPESAEQPYGARSILSCGSGPPSTD